MQPSNPIKLMSTKVHKISIAARKKLDQGSCTIYQEGDVHFMKVNHFIHNLKNMIFGEVVYAKSVSYFWYEESEEGFVHVLSVYTDDNSEEALKNFRSALGNHAVVKDLISMENECELYKRVKQAYPEFESKEVLNTSNAFTKISKQVGSLAGTISGLLTKPAEKVGATIEEKTESIVESQVGEGTKSKWQSVRQNISKLNGKMTQSIKPVSDASKNLSSKIGHSFNHSENPIVKAVRDLGRMTKDSLNQGYQQATKQPESHKPLPAESDSVLEVNVKKVES